ncbi:unnamed protein product, partial [Ectocarpus sp. 13 AM-2016]
STRSRETRCSSRGPKHSGSMADSPPVTRKRGRHNDGDRAVTRDRRNAGSDWRESLRNSRQEEMEKAVADKRKKLVRAIPTTIPGVSAVVRGDARSDIREIEALVDMQVLQPEEMAPGAVQATPRPPMPKANQLEPKRARMARWKKDPSEMEKDMAKQREALKKAEKEDEQLEAERDAWERWYLVLRAHLTAGRRPTATWSPAAAAAAAAAAAPAAAAASSTTTSNESHVSGGDSDSSGDENVAAAGGAGGGGGGSSNSSTAGGGSGDGTGKAVDDGRYRRGGEEEEEEERVRGLEAEVMKRAGLEGKFDMTK